MADKIANGTGEACPASKMSSLNCIDLSNPDIHQSVALLKQACLDSGFFYLINHGMSEEFMDEAFAQSKKLFSLPLSEKMKLCRTEKNRGYVQSMQETLDFENNSYDSKEVYSMSVEVAEDDPDAKKPFYGSNVWPPADIFPGWKETMLRYHQEALEVARRVARLVALALDLNIDFFDQPHMLAQRPIANLRLLHYEGQNSDLSKGIYGVGPHYDFGLLTLLATDDVVGLQICRNRDAKPQIWEYVPPLKGAFIVNIGDMLERLSNGIFRSTLHRVLAGKERYSIAFFVYPNDDCDIECLTTCKSEENPPKFPPIKCGELLSSRYKELRTGRGK